MKNNDKHSRLNWRIAVAVFVMFIPYFSFSQVRIDWQYCYGGEDNDNGQCILPVVSTGMEVVKIIQAKDGGFLVGSSNNEVLYDYYILKVSQNGEIEDSLSL